MAILKIEVPEGVLSALRQSPREAEKEVRLAAAIDWYRRGLVSQGKAAEVARIPRADFLDELAERKIETVHVDLEDLKREMEID
jgi:predicted HTH domain antitoxin